MSILFVLICFLMAGIGTGVFLPVAETYAIIATVGCLIVLAMSVVGRRRLFGVIAIVAFVIGWIRPGPTPEKHTFVEQPEEPCRRLIQGTLAADPVCFDDKIRMSVSIEHRSGCLSKAELPSLAKASGRLNLTVLVDKENGATQTLPYQAGDGLLLVARIKPLVLRRNPGSRSYEFTQSMYTAVTKDAPSIALVEYRSGPRRLFRDLRTNLATFWRDNLNADTANLARALSLGQSKVLSHSQRERFRRTGTAHLLSVSGLHLGFLALFTFGIVNRILLRTSISRRIDVGRLTAVLTIPLVIAFTVLVGCKVPVVRACVMITSALLARALGRTSSMAEAVAVAGALILIESPTAMLEPGFQLSFVAVISFAATLAPSKKNDDLNTIDSDDSDVSRGRHFKQWIIENFRRLLRSSVAAAAATGPLVLFHFGYISLVTIPANLIAVPLTGFVIMPGVLSVTALADIFPRLASLLAGPVGFALGALDWILELIALAPCTIENPGLVFVSGFTVGCIAVLFFLAHLKRFAAVIAVCAATLIFSSPFADPSKIEPGKLTLDFIDVGHGDATLITFPDGRSWLVDAGGAWGASRGDTYDVGQRVVVPVLRALGVSKLNTLIITHPDLDHVGGAPAIANEVEVEQVWDNGQGQNEGVGGSYQKLMDMAEQGQYLVRRTPSICKEHQMGGVTISVIHPCYEEESFDVAQSFNNNSLVLVLRYGDISIMLPGDIEKETERDLIDKNLINQVDILKLPHHGSNTSSSDAFLDAASPKIAVGSLGSFDPHADEGAVFKKLEKRGVHVERTDRNGAIRVVTDGHSVSISNQTDLYIHEF